MSNLLGAAEVRALADQLNLKPTKKLGQNFVVDANTCLKIVKLATIEKSDIALEIGPGLGSLTLALLEEASQVIAIEIDSRLADQLSITAADRGFDQNKLKVINDDAISVRDLPFKPTVLVANLPYNVSVPVLLNILEHFPTITRGVIMVQSEVADRLVAVANNKDYGSPTVKANWWANLKIVGHVSRSVFWPIPNVDSSLVRFDRHLPAAGEAERAATFAVIDHAFAKRRKMLRSALSQLFRSNTESALIQAGIDPTSRGEVLTVEQFLKIGKQLLNDKSTK
ncbi:MAG: 16S rRNA (adenine(1518)-N(6)/adenine(1519)-N(6))-dimethyltransferase RsmA [Actinobacteria bacterium]|nr:16S rRNA (adenine(1518)-N(6)/adenine(1519)-N(6))-dimethyltransferase RsmA [Actinomycetota bacterium]